MIWNSIPDLQQIKTLNKNTLADNIGIEIIEVGDDFIKSKMPVNERTKQPMGLLHGGASLVLSETMGSIASFWIVENPMINHVVGVEINANHLNSATNGYVFGITKPIKIGKTLHIWQTDIFDENHLHLCTSRLTVMIKQNKI